MKLIKSFTSLFLKKRKVTAIVCVFDKKRRLKICSFKKIASEQDENSNLLKQNGHSVWLEFAICEINLSISLKATLKWQWPNNLLHDCIEPMLAEYSKLNSKEIRQKTNWF